MRILDEIRKDPLGWVIILAVALLMLFALTHPAKSHSFYPPECCGVNDCDVVTNVSFVTPVGSNHLPLMVVTTKYGTAIVPKDFPSRQSPDGQMHACMWLDNNRHPRTKLICIWIPPTT